MHLGDAVPWAVIGVLLTALGILVPLWLGSRQRVLRQDLRKLLQDVRTECDKAVRTIKTGGDLPELPAVIANAHDRLKSLYGEIRYVSDEQLATTSMLITNVSSAWVLVTQQISQIERAKKDDRPIDGNDVRRRTRSEDLLIEQVGHADKVIGRMLTKLRRLNSGNIVGAFLAH